MPEPWELFQQDVADAIKDGHVRGGSGSAWHTKGDVINKDLLIECKFTEKDSFSIKRSVIRKAQKEAAGEGRMFALAIGFPDPKLPSTVRREGYVLIRLEDFAVIMENQKDE